MLKDRELTDLVNYVLGLPLKRNPDGGGIVRRDPISPFVIRTLNKKRWARIEDWAELMLQNDGVLPKPKRYRNNGRRAGCPPEIQRFVVYDHHFYEGVPKKKPESALGLWAPEVSHRSRDGGKKSA